MCLIQHNDSGKKVCKCTLCDGVCAGTAGTDWCETCWNPEAQECMLCPCCGAIHSPSGLIMDRDAYMAYGSDTELEIARSAKKNEKNAERRVACKAKKEKQEEKTRVAKKARTERRDADPKGKEADCGSGGPGGSVVSSGGPGGSTGTTGTDGSGGTADTAVSGGSGGTADTAASGATGDVTGTDAKHEHATSLLSLPGTTRENPVIL